LYCLKPVIEIFLSDMCLKKHYYYQLAYSMHGPIVA